MWNELNLLVLIVALVSMLVSVASIIVSVILHNKELNDKKRYHKNIQKDLVKSIETQLRIIGQNIYGHKEELDKDPPIIPSYDIHLLNADFYLTNLRSKIEYYETETLKEAIIKASNKTRNINRLLHLAQDFDSHVNDNTTKNPHVTEIKEQNYKYHFHLERLLKIIREDVNDILYHKHPKLIEKHFRRRKIFKFAPFSFLVCP